MIYMFFTFIFSVGNVCEHLAILLKIPKGCFLRSDAIENAKRTTLKNFLCNEKMIARGS